MPDMLVKLYNLPPLEPVLQEAAGQGIAVRPAMHTETHRIRDFIGQHFAPGWVEEAMGCFHDFPVRCHIAVKDNSILGFCCWDTSARGFLGPMGVDPALRGQGVGRALLLSALHAMRSYGYGYAIIGWVGPAAFYEKVCGAQVIEDSEPGIYLGMLR